MVFVKPFNKLYKTHTTPLLPCTLKLPVHFQFHYDDMIREKDAKQHTLLDLTFMIGIYEIPTPISRLNV